MIRNFSDSVIILKRINYSEADRILTVLSSKYGKITCIAKGVRKLSSRKAPHIEPLTHTKLYFSKTKGMPLVTQAENIDSFDSLKNNLETTRLALQMAEVVDKLTLEDQHYPSIFKNFLKALTYLNQSTNLPQEKQELLISRFHIKLLEELGFGQPKNKDLLATTAFIESIIDRRLTAQDSLK